MPRPMLMPPPLAPLPLLGVLQPRLALMIIGMSTTTMITKKQPISSLMRSMR